MTNAQQPWEQWVGEETISMLYARGIERWGGAGSAPRDGCVEAALGAAYNAEIYSPDEEQEGLLTGLIFSCYLLFYLSTKHCYVDGNKRIAWACMTFVLLRFGLTLKAAEDDVVEFCMSISKGEVRAGSGVVSWVSERLVSIT